MTINTHDLTTLTQNNDADEDSSQEDSVDIAQLRTPLKVDLSPIYEFLGARTTQAWVDAALADLPLIIQDHANNFGDINRRCTSLNRLNRLRNILLVTSVVTQ